MKALGFESKEIKIGDTIVYPSRHSSSLWMNKGVVLDIGYKDTYYKKDVPFLVVKKIREGSRVTNYGNKPFKNVVLTRLSNVVVINVVEIKEPVGHRVLGR